MPKLISLYIRHVLIGFALAGVFVAGLLWFDVAHLGHLVSTSDIGILAVFLLWFSNGIVFAGVQFGIAVTRMSGSEDGSGGHRKPRKPVQMAAPKPVPVPVAEKRR
ncbi:MAG: hypothetical protein ACJA06_002003 [Halocynthiibacter sp.]|jgi:hypothetical protein